MNQYILQEVERFMILIVGFKPKMTDWFLRTLGLDGRC